MKNRFLASAVAALLALVAPFAGAGGKLSLSDKVLLQAAMQSHIDGVSIDGRFPYLDAAGGEVRLLRQRAAHPVIMRMGEYFILCSDFEAPGGADVNIDFFVAARDGGYRVFGQRAGDHDYLMRLMKAGKAERVD